MREIDHKGEIKSPAPRPPGHAGMAWIVPPPHIKNNSINDLIL
ncbi:hypothetical protein [Burkholderia gladioli]|nr:hypothetical protein [Burkholderia gladioli]